MSERKNRWQMLSDGFVLLLLAMFALFSTFLVLVSAQAYRNTVQAADANAQSRILEHYAVNKARMYDRAGGMTIRQTDVGTALCLRDEYDGDRYLTYVYCADGALRELVREESEGFDPEDGDAICPAAAFEARWDGGLLTFTATAPTGESYVSFFAPRCAGEEAAP